MGRMARRVAPDTIGRQAKRVKVLSLTDDERARLAAVLRNLRKFHGSWARLAELMGVSINTLQGVSKGRDFGSMRLAVKTAKLAGLLVDDMLHGKPVAADHCPHCHQPLPAGRVTSK